MIAFYVCVGGIILLTATVLSSKMAERSSKR